jgi:CubicO group peptidase (beta-lactamase class C family)
MKVDAEAAGMDEARLERITEHFNHRYLDPGKIWGCQITVSRGTNVAYFRSLGNMDQERAKPVSEDTIWRIYSMTKPITSVALMQLYEQGHFQLVDPVHRYIPEWRDLMVEERDGDGQPHLRAPERPMSVRDALTHMTGLAGSVIPAHPSDERYNTAVSANKRGMTLAGVCTVLADIPLKFDPGTRWNYGVSTDICARLVEIISGQRFDDYLNDHLFEPLGMVDTGFVVPPEKAERFASCYRYVPGQHPSLMDDAATSSYLRSRSYLSGAGGLVSTSTDYLRFCQMLVGGGQLDGRRVIGRKTLELMTCNHLPGGATLQEVSVGGFGEAGFDGVGFGLGFAVGQGPAATLMAGSPGEFYWGGAASTAFWVDPVEELSVVFMTQLLPSAAYPFRAQLRALVNQALAD